MTEQDLLDRYVAKANRVAELEKEVAQLRQTLYQSVRAARQEVYECMAKAAVNCGPHSGCWLAQERLKRAGAS